jgi:hypothetical protein
MKTLQYCISQVQNDLQDFSPSRLIQFGQFAINTYKRYYLFGAGPQSIEVLYATPDRIGAIPMPTDYEDYTKVAIQSRGQYFTLTLNNDLLLNRRVDCGEEVLEGATTVELNQISVPYNYYFAPHFRAGNYVGEMYSVTGGYNNAGYFTVDNKLRRFIVSNVPQTEIVIEYISNGANINSLVEDAAIDMIRYGIHDQLATFDRVMNQAEKQRIGDKFYAAIDNYNTFKTVPTVDEYKDAIWASMKSTIKR